MEAVAKIGVALVIAAASFAGVWVTKDSNCLWGMLLIPITFNYWPTSK